ncbi:SEL1-like repeat protein [Histomonas meleagridis]|nr:SEL1-like repeat protein [Histomonas meleagridis]
MAEKAGDPLTYRNLGLMYLSGVAGEKDEKKGFRYIRKAINGGDNDAKDSVLEYFKIINPNSEMEEKVKEFFENGAIDDEENDNTEEEDQQPLDQNLCEIY